MHSYPPTQQKVYLADSRNHHIQILNSDLTYCSSFGSYGRAIGQFCYPWDLAFDSIGNVYVADTQNHSVQVFTADGEFLRKFGKRGSGNGELNTPTDICIDGNNVAYVTELNNRVSVFTCEGKFLTCSNYRLVEIDKDGILYISDIVNSCLQLF